MARPVRGLNMDSDQRRELESLVRAPTTPQRSVQRARILLACADGLSQQEAARQVGVRRRIVTKWCGRFRKLGLAGLADARGRGRKPFLSEESRAIILTQATRPPKGQTRHSVRSMARTAQVSVGTVHALWQANDIKPHLTRTFKLSNDPQFEAKFWDVIGLYLNPPDRALVLCCDEKSQCQALERTQPGLPLGVGHIKTRTHDYIRHGTTCLYAALRLLDGVVLGTCRPHTAVLRYRIVHNRRSSLPIFLGAPIDQSSIDSRCRDDSAWRSSRNSRARRFTGDGRQDTARCHGCR